jgi:predicted RecA/RadA family phage recombinase
MPAPRVTVVRNSAIKSGVGFGSALAIAISYTTHQSVLWAIIHGIFSWIYVVYFVLTR